MTQEEGNKLIAEFMNLRLGMAGDVINGDADCHLLQTKYHTSWDWLQPAWSKFYVLCETTLRGKENMYNEFTDFRDNYNIHANHNNIKAACETLVEALQWYNQNPQ